MTIVIHGLVSQNGGTPKSSNLIGISIINHPSWGTPIFGNIHMAWFPPLHTDTPPLQVAVLDAHPLRKQAGLTKDQFHGCLFLRRITTTFQRWIRHWTLGHWDAGWATRGLRKNAQKCELRKKTTLGCGFKYFSFLPLFGEDFQFDSYFSKGLKPPTRTLCLSMKCWLFNPGSLLHL